MPVKSSQAHVWKASCRNYKIHLHMPSRLHPSLSTSSLLALSVLPGREIKNPAGRAGLHGEPPRPAHLLSSGLVAREALQTHPTFFGCASTRLLCWDLKYTQKCWTLKCFHRLQLLKPFTSHRQPLTYVGDEKTSFPPEVQENSGAGSHVLHNSLTTRRILDGKISLPCVD